MVKLTAYILVSPLWLNKERSKQVSVNSSPYSRAIVHTCALMDSQGKHTYHVNLPVGVIAEAVEI